MRSAIRVPAYLALTVLLAGCVRALDVGSEPSPVYRLTVANDLAEEMIVSTSDSQGTSLLGAVPPGRAETFVVAGTRGAAISVTARNATGSRTVGPLQVTLALGETVTVRLR
ncbi:MAG TPA: hypothetical protein VK929_02080 [Longimicrobiales bacterium]|nr:hypothetical protein [Longimicrobiales bacterium]